MAFQDKSIHSDDHTRGNVNAPLILVEYGDYECPRCAALEARLSRLSEEMGDSLCIVYRHFPVSQTHPHAFSGAIAAEAAGRQGKFWEMHELIYENQEILTHDAVEQYARALELDVDQFLEDISNTELVDRVKRDFRSGVRSGIRATPGFYLNGLRYSGSLDASLLRTFLEVA